MHIKYLIYFLLSCLLIFRLSVTPAAALEFEHVGNGGNCTGCEWIRASGIVEKGDAERLERALVEKSYSVEPFRQHNLIMFDSPGGNLAAGIALGKKIRELGFSVGVGRSEKIPDSSFYELTDGQCISACAYAFLGGKYRYLDSRPGFDDGKSKTCLGFHQFYDKRAIVRNDALSTQETTQIISGIIVEYLTEIEIPLDVYTFASKFTGQEYGCLNRDKALSAKIDNANFEYRTATLLPFGKGLVAEIKSRDDERTMRLYCMAGGKFLIAYFLPGDKVSDYKSVLEFGTNINNGLVFTAGQTSITPGVELVQLIAKGKKTAIVFTAGKKLIESIFDTGSIDTGKSTSGRAQQSWFNSFNFAVNGSKKIPGLLAKNCIS